MPHKFVHRRVALLLGAMLMAGAVSAADWQEGSSYTAGATVDYNGKTYSALISHTAYAGANWNPASTPTLWKEISTSVTAAPKPSATPPQPCPIPTPPGPGAVWVGGDPANGICTGGWVITVSPTPPRTVCPELTTPPQPTVQLKYPMRWELVTTRDTSNCLVNQWQTACPSGSVMVGDECKNPLPVVTPTASPQISSVPADNNWNASTVYTVGKRVSYNGATYEAKWWTQGEAPSSSDWGPWKLVSGAIITTTPAFTPTPTPKVTPIGSCISPGYSPECTPTPAPVITPTPSPTPTYIPPCPGYSTGMATAMRTCPPPPFTPAPTPVVTAAPTAAPTATPTAAPVPTPCATVIGNGGCNSTLPKHALIGYWHNFTNPSGDTYRIRDVAPEWDVIMISFADDAGNGAVAFNLDKNAGTEAEFIADVAAKRAQGKKVVLSLGGQEGRMTLSSKENVSNFVNSLHTIITKYGFDGIDLDLESGAGVVLGTPIINNLIDAVKQLKAKVGPSFYLSMAPEHPYVQGGYVAYSGIWGAYLPIIDGLRDDLNMIHVQYYNNGGLWTPYSNSALNEGTVDGLVGGSLMLIEGFKTVGGTGWEFKGLRPDQVAFGVPSGRSSANTGFVSNQVVTDALTCLTQLKNCGMVKPKQAYPDYRGVMTWSINWDKKDGYNFSKPTSATLKALPK